MGPMARVRAALARRDGLAQIGVVLAALGAYEGARMLMVPDWDVAFSNAHSVVSFERVTGLAWEGSVQQVFLGMPDVVEAMNVFYFVGHFLLTGAFFLWLYHRSRDGFRLYRNAFLVATALAVVVHWRSRRRRRGLRASGCRTPCSSCPGSTSARRARARCRTRSPRCRASTPPTRSVSGSASPSTAARSSPGSRASSIRRSSCSRSSSPATTSSSTRSRASASWRLGFLLAWRFGANRRSREERSGRHACLT